MRMGATEQDGTLTDQLANIDQPSSISLEQLLSSVDNLPPSFRRTVNLVQKYDQAQPKDQDRLIGMQASLLATDPQAVVDEYNNLDLLAATEFGLTVDEIKSKLPKEFQSALSFPKKLLSYTPEKIELLVGLGLTAQGDSKIALDALTAAVFNAPATLKAKKGPREKIEAAVDIQYNATWILVTTQDPEIRQELFEILCFVKPWFRADSFTGWLITNGSIIGDDDHLGKFYAINTAVQTIGELIATLEAGIKSGSEVAVHREDLLATNHSIVHSHLDGEERILWDQVHTQLNFQEVSRANAINQFLREPRPEAVQTYNNPETIEDVLRGDPSSAGQKLDAITEVEQSILDLDWPANIIFNPNHPLRQLVNTHLGPEIFTSLWEILFSEDIKAGFEMLTSTSVELDGTLCLRVYARNVTSEEERNRIVRAVTNAIATGKSDFPGFSPAIPLDSIVRFANHQGGAGGSFNQDKSIKFVVFHQGAKESIGALSSVIEYYRPILTAEQTRAAQEKGKELRQEIRGSMVRGIGKRGYQVFAEPTLRHQFGIHSLSFRHISPQGDIEVEIALGENGDSTSSYNFQLDKSFRLVPGRDINRFLNLQDRAWLELITLSHLKSVLCTQEADIPHSLLGGKYQFEQGYQRQTYGRVGHLRQQGPNMGFSQEAFELHLQSSHFHLGGRDLITINREKGNSKSSGMITYVKPVEEVDASNLPPIRVSYQVLQDIESATGPLDQLSAEETNRQTNQILADVIG